MTAARYDPVTASLEEVLQLATELPGLRLGDLLGAVFGDLDAGHSRHESGAAIEAYFGIGPNSSPEPDFPNARLELKAVPLITRMVGLRVKERTSISQINYHSLVKETWETASVRKKLNILFVFFEVLPGRSKKDFPIQHVFHWSPSGVVLNQIRRDWLAVQRKVAGGRAHELSESDGFILGPCTKSSGKQNTSQPYSDVEARRRAFAFKSRFVLALYRESLSRRPETDTLVELSTSSSLMRAYGHFSGRTVGDVARLLGRQLGASKSSAALVVHEAVRRSSPVERREFNAVGPTVRSPRVSPSLYPYEAVSFSPFKHIELIDERWEDSALLDDIQHMLLAPRVGLNKSTPPAECTIGQLVEWKPGAAYLDAIEKEWRMFQRLIREGKAGSLPSESSTQTIHVRPHGRNAADRDSTPGGGDQAKKSFWLNKQLIHDILRGETAR